ncbi:MAG: hypothetical protein QOI86_2348 [Actinomycetota bacterium]|jgi:hypothetical protein|nr:hypothetical protein [Actinomycetota bacterium]
MEEDFEFLTLHCLTMKQLAGPAHVEAIVGVPAAEAKAALARLVESGDVKEARGNYVLMPAGRERLAGRYGDIYKSVRQSDTFTAGYARFERVNNDLKRLITDWQTITVAGQQTPNDHSDPDYDHKIVDRLGAIHERVEPILDAFAAEVPRLSRHKDRLNAAVDRIFAGEKDYMSGVRVDSYHTVWFELHEDLLRILDTERDD